MSATLTVASGTLVAAKGSTSTSQTPHGTYSVDFVAIPAARAGLFWPHALPHIKRVAARFPGEIDLDRTRADIDAGRTHLWIAWRDGVVGASLTQIIEYPGFKAVRILALGGERFARWTDTAVGWFERFAEHHGCRRLEFYGRRGWERWLPEWRMDRIMMTKDVGDGR